MMNIWRGIRVEMKRPSNHQSHCLNRFEHIDIILLGLLFLSSIRKPSRCKSKAKPAAPGLQSSFKEDITTLPRERTQRTMVYVPVRNSRSSCYSFISIQGPRNLCSLKKSTNNTPKTKPAPTPPNAASSSSTTSLANSSKPSAVPISSQPATPQSPIKQGNSKSSCLSGSATLPPIYPCILRRPHRNSPTYPPS